MNLEILNLNSRVVFFPVRHHSPTAARLVHDLVLKMRPTAVLIEGPSDFNLRINELFLPHKLPIAIYTYFRHEKDQRGAFYPFCIYSPEWQAGKTAHQQGGEVAFIDMPWQQMAQVDTRQNCYADGELREGNFIELACKRLRLESFDELWDELIEAPNELSLAEYMKRCHTLCYQMRHSRPQINFEDIVRERFMAETIKKYMKKPAGQILVVTGGFHSHALFERMHGINKDDERAGADDQAPGFSRAQITEAGIALTPYSYARLDSLTGYEAGMPSPGFYHQTFIDRNAHTGHDTHKTLLFEAAKALRKKKQAVSSADLIAVETSALGLARLRGHEHVWRSDLIDGIMSALVKDEIVSGILHPMLDALHEIFRGDARGVLAEGTMLPPLVDDIKCILEDWGLSPVAIERAVQLELTDSEALEKSRILHRLRCLGISGFSLVEASELGGDEQGKIFEDWTIKWTPNFDSSCIESSVYGASLEEAASNRLLEACGRVNDDSEKAAEYLGQACSMGISRLGEKLCQQLKWIINKDQRFHSVALCAEKLLFLFKYDQLLTEKPLPELGSLLRAAFDRSLWLLESLGKTSGNDSQSIKAISALVDIIERCGRQLELDRKYMLEVFSRSRLDKSQAAIICGALTGALWVLEEAQLEEISSDITFFAEPQSLGDFLTGLFHLAREVLQRNSELIKRLDAVLMSFDDEQFLEAAPSMRQAFSFFSPREKHYIASAILAATSTAGGPSTSSSGGGAAAAGSDLLAPLAVDFQTAERALLIESRMLAALKRFGIRRGQ